MTYTLLLKDGKRFDRIPLAEVKRLLLSEGYSLASVENLFDRAIGHRTEEDWIRRMDKACAEIEHAIRMVRERSREIDRELSCLFGKSGTVANAPIFVGSHAESSPKASTAAGGRRGRRP